MIQPGSTFISAAVPVELDDRVRVAAARLRISRSEFFRRAAEGLLENLEAQAAPKQQERKNATNN